MRHDHELVAVFVQNRRWDFRWDVAGCVVAAWSTELDTGHPGQDHDGLVMNSEELLRWAEGHRAEIRAEQDTIDGRRARKIVLRWPGPPGGAMVLRAETIWFDPDSLRPVKRLVEFDDGQSIETRIDLYAEPCDRQERRRVATCYALYVALDETLGRPRPVPPLLIETDEDRVRLEQARARQAARLARRAEALQS